MKDYREAWKEEYDPSVEIGKKQVPIGAKTLAEAIERMWTEFDEFWEVPARFRF